MIALYLDENIPPLVAKTLQDERYDVVSAHEVGMAGKPDDEQLRYAAADGRAILTFNQKHFRPLYDEWWFEGRTHCGIILSREFKIDEVAELLRLIRNLIERNQPQDLHDSLTFLRQYR
ncbi:MAG: DUF5615 family PIN-like protein [Chloroflexi bacterium]|nr:DUF5615 family PIN-like protein [Chloroflexota bacterium]